jgi:DNA-binding response OmpR family regulator
MRTGATQTVLVVDDEPLLGDALGRLLIRSGYDAQVTFTAEHAEFVASGQTFDCAIIDVYLGEADGVELACRLLRAGRIKKVVFYTGLIEDDTLRRALDVGVCVEKAARFEELRWAVEEAVDGDGAR